MTVIDELNDRKELKEAGADSPIDSGGYIRTKATLQPVDIFQLVETLQTASPLLVQILKNFGIKMGMQKKQLDEFLKYEKSITQLIAAIEQDYLK